MPRGTTSNGTTYGRIGNDTVNAGYFNSQNPINEAGAYLNLGNFGIRGGVMGDNSLTPMSAPEYYAMAAMDSPALYNMPTYEGALNTPIGQFGLQAGGLEDAAGVRGSYTPNANAQQVAAEVLKALLGR